MNLPPPPPPPMGPPMGLPGNFAPGIAPAYPIPPPPPPQNMQPVLNVGPPFLPPPPPPPPAWRGLTHFFVKHRPAGSELDTFEDRCNVVQQNARPCQRAAAHYPKNFLPVCKLHKKKRVAFTHCQAEKPGRGRKVCNRKIKFKPHFYELCNDHRDWGGMPCYFMKLPSEIRMQIFKYLLPDRPISAWLDTSLRCDRYKCTTSILLLNKEIYAEASEVLYRTQPFTVSIQRNAINMAGRSYYHDLNSSQHHHPHAPMSLPVRPPMLDKVKSIRIQMTMVKPSGRLHRRAGRVRSMWDEEVESYDIRDSVNCFVKMLQTATSIQGLSVVFCIQNQVGQFENDELFDFIKIVSEPFTQLMDISRTKLHPIYYSTDTWRMNTSQYIPDHIQPKPVESLPGSETADGLFDLSNSFDTYGMDNVPVPLLQVRKRLHDHEGFLAYKAEWEGLLSSTDVRPPPLANRRARKADRYFRRAYYTIDQYYYQRLPKGKEWLLHRSRVAREKGDVEAIGRLLKELESKFQALLDQDQLTLDGKKSRGFARIKRCETSLRKQGAALGESGSEAEEMDDGTSSEISSESE